MAQQGMFGSSFQQAVTDENALRLQQAQTGGLTGWAAITNAMSGIGSQIGYQGGQAMGGQTPAQAQQAQFQAVMDSVPNYDPSNPESMMELSAALRSAGFYDQALEMFNMSNKVKSDNLMYKVAELEYEKLKAPAARKTQILGDGYTYYVDTFADEGGPKRVDKSIEKEPTGTAENQALKQKRNEFIEKAGGDETAGNEAFLEYTQALDLTNATAAAKIDLGTSIFKSTMKVRDNTSEKLGKISTGISTFTQALGGSPPAAEVSATLIAQIFEDQRQATSEIARIASAGGLVENVGDFVSNVFSGTKTAQHYAAFIKVLQIYEQEQLAKYNGTNDSMRKIGVDYGFDIPESVFEAYIPRDGSKKGQVRTWIPDASLPEGGSFK